MSTIYAGSVPYDTTPDDALWLARALDGEGGDERAVAATLIQRWVMLRERGSDMTLGELVQAYAQAVSPLWLADGARCRPGGIGHGTPACDPERTAARARRRARPWHELRQEAQDAAVWALYTDELPDYLPRVVHYATSALVAARMSSREARRDGWTVANDAPADGHRYIRTTESESMPRLRVLPGPVEELDAAAQLRTAAPRRLPAPRGDASAGPGAGLLAVVGLLGAVAVSRRRR